MNKWSRTLWKSRFWWLPTLILLVILNYLSTLYHGRIDLTDEKRFTISAPVKKMLGQLKEDVLVEVFLKGEFPSGFKNLAGTTMDLLREFKEIGGPRFQYRFISPNETIPGTEIPYSDTLQALGAEPINLTVQLKEGEKTQFVYPTALVHYGDRSTLINLYPGTKKFITPAELNSAEAGLEYKFALAIDKVVRAEKPLIAYTVGNGQPVDARVFDLVENVLKPDYDLRMLDPGEVPVISDTFKMLLVIKPSVPFTEPEKMRLDQYVMHGGKILWMIDRLEAEMDSLQIKNQVVAYDRNLNLEDLLFRYGARINPDLLMDLQCDFLPFDVNGNEQFELLHWNYFPLFESPSNHLINKNLGLVSGRFVNTIDTVNAQGIRSTKLLSSSANSRSISAPALISGEENRNAPEDAAFRQKNLMAAVLLEGKFTSLYANRMPAAMQDSFNVYGQPFLSSSIEDNRMIIVSDGDVALNGTSRGQPLMMGLNPYTIGTQYEYRFSNREFVQNSIEYLVNSAGLMEARAKDRVLRVLDKKKTEDERLKWQVLNLLLPVVLILLFGLSFRWWRRKKYS